jgi:predicted Zn-dependent protease
VFAETLKDQRKNVRVLALAQTLGAIYKAGLADAYRSMYAYHRETGLFRADVLEQIAKATQARYMAHIQVQGFEQYAKERFGIFGLRIVETKSAAVRLFFQVWDSRDGTVAWEATEEVHYSYDTVTEEQLTLPQVVGRAAEDLIVKLP